MEDLQRIDHPIVLVISYGSLSPEDIISNIQQKANSDDAVIVDAATKVSFYKCHVSTKYYETDILLSPFESNPELYPKQFLERVEGILIYFDAKNRNLLEKIESHALFIQANHIELAILLCDELADDPADGITFKEAKQHSKLLDVVELERKPDDDDNEYNPHDPIGYDEVIQAFKNCIWSNASLSGESRLNTAYKFHLNEETAPDTSCSSRIENLTEAEIDAQLAGFEKILSGVLQFRSTTDSWSRNERLTYANDFVDILGSIIDEDTTAPVAAPAVEATSKTPPQPPPLTPPPPPADDDTSSK